MQTTCTCKFKTQAEGYKSQIENKRQKIVWHGITCHLATYLAELEIATNTVANATKTFTWRLKIRI